MKRKLLRSVAGIMASLMLVLSFSAVGIAENGKSQSFIFEDDICDVKAQQIIATINGEVGITPNSLLCLFGHSLAKATVWEIVCKVYPAAPRCVENTYDVTYCTRTSCNYNVATLIATRRIYHCA